jgi:multidrug efflux pump
MVLSAVLLPMAFFGGSTGVIYRQFSVTIVAAMALSVLVALVLSPALCATMLKPGDHRSAQARGLFRQVQPLARPSDHAYLGVVGRVMGRRVLHHGRVCGHCGGDGAAVRAPAHRLPAGRGSGHGDGLISLPAGATAERTDAVIDQMQKHYMDRMKRSVARHGRSTASASTVRGRMRAWALSRLCRLTTAGQGRLAQGDQHARDDAFSKIMDARCWRSARPPSGPGPVQRLPSN